MDLPQMPPVAPMLAKRTDRLPDGDGWLYEPKWDGFRALVFRDGDEWYLQSRDKKPLARYFPELESPVLEQLPARCVLDGEIVITSDDGLDFDALLQRIHPAASRIAKLAAATPASFVAWDLLAIDDEDLVQTPFVDRRARLESELAGVRAPLHVTPVTADRAVAADWFERFEGAGLDGVMAKRVEEPYQPDKRVMLKIKHKRTCECVVAGFRWHKNGPGELVGSLLLGLYDEDGTLHHVGVAAGFKTTKRRELVAELEPYRANALDDHPWKSWAEHEASDQRMPGGTSRWSRKKEARWEPVRPELVCEVTYDHMQGTRFRHGARFLRWRTDKPPRECDYAQLHVTPAIELAKVFRG